MIGLEVEGVTDPSAALKPFRIAKVLTAREAPERGQAEGSPCRHRRGRTRAGGLRGAERAGGAGRRVRGAGDAHPGTGVDLAIGTIRGVESRA